jgi:hypothetical protein
VRFAGARLDAIDGRLQVEVERLAGDDRQILYRFVVGDGTTPFAEGRATVVLNTPLPADPTSSSPEPR